MAKRQNNNSTDKTGLHILSLSISQTSQKKKKKRNQEERQQHPSPAKTRGGKMHITAATRWRDAGTYCPRPFLRLFLSDCQQDRVCDRRISCSSIPAAPHPPDPQICSHAAVNGDAFRGCGRFHCSIGLLMLAFAKFGYLNHKIIEIVIFNYNNSIICALDMSKLLA